MKTGIRYFFVSTLFFVSSVAFAVTDSGTGQPENTDSTFDLLAWMLSWLPF